MVLAPYRVLDLTDESGFLCGKILADLGADVIKLEPPGGDPARRFDDRSLYWTSHNAGKRSITLNLDRPGARDMLRKLAARADFLINTFPPEFLERCDLGFESLRKINPRIVVVSITPFGQTGPYSNYKGSDLIAMAMSGLMSLIGEAGQMPLRVTLPQSPMWAGMYATGGALIAHYYRETSGVGQNVDASLQSCLLWALANGPAFWATNRTNPTRDGGHITGRSMSGARMRAIYECKDGYLNFIIYGGRAGRRSNEALVQWLAEHGLATESLLKKDWNQFGIETSTQEEIDEIERPMEKLFKLYTKAQFLEEAFNREMLGYPVASAHDILQDPHLGDREFWWPVDESHFGMPIKFPGLFARFSEVPSPGFRAAASVGQHNCEIYESELGLSAGDIVRLHEENVI